jgi:hypothetical protein
MQTTPARESTTAANEASARRLMKAMRERDHATLADVLAPDVVINSPITDRFAFRGREDGVALLMLVLDTMEDLEHHELLGTGDVWTQRFRVRVRGRLLEGVDMLRFDEAGRVRELTVFVRPMPGLAAFAAAVAPRAGRRRSRLVALVLHLLTAPLAAITPHGDRLAAWLLRGAWWTGSAS